MKKLILLVACICLLFVPTVESQSVFGRPIVITWDRSSQDYLPDYPTPYYFTYRATFDQVTGNCNRFSKIGGSGNQNVFTDNQTIPGITYCYTEAMYSGGAQSPLSDIPAIVQVQ